MAFVVRKLGGKTQAANDKMSDSIVSLLESMVVENPLDGISLSCWRFLRSKREF